MLGVRPPGGGSCGWGGVALHPLLQNPTIKILSMPIIMRIGL